jgi:colanic acid biosynthesis protein WcaH
MDKGRLTDDEYCLAYSLVPRACIDFIVCDSEGKILLTQRDIEPHKGKWHLPGGRLKKDESIDEAIVRITNAELGKLDISGKKLIDAMEFIPDGLLANGVPVHSISFVYQVDLYGGEIEGSFQASNCSFFKLENIPAREEMIPQHHGMLLSLNADRLS